MMKPRIVLSGGGTGGSVTALLAVAAVLRERADLLFVGGFDGPERQLADRAGLSWRAIPAGKLRRYFSWRNFSDFGKIYAGYRAAREVIVDWRPQVVVSAGSYVSVPMIWAAHRAGLRTLIHQQDLQPGLANRLMTRAADVVTVAFAPSQKFWRAGKTTVVGNPVRPGILTGTAAAAQQHFSLDRQRPTVLIIGGGTGSAALNSLVAAALPPLTSRWNVIHLTGPHRGPVVMSQEFYHPYAFLGDDMALAYAAADVVVTRAGLGVLSELMALAKPTIVLPMPNTHQEANASFIKEQQAGWVLDQRTTTATTLVEAITALWADPRERLHLATRLHQLYRPEAAERLAEIILSLARP